MKHVAVRRSVAEGPRWSLELIKALIINDFRWLISKKARISVFLALALLN